MELANKKGRRIVHEIFDAPERTVEEELRMLGFPGSMIDGFFRPFLGGIFLDPALQTSSRMLYFVYRMQKYKTGRMKFDQEFMATRRKAMDLAVEALEADVRPDIDQGARQSGLMDVLERPYASWLKALVDYYSDLLAANGDSFETLVRSAYRNRTNCLLILNRLNTVEKEFYSALKPQMAATEGAAAIIAAIETNSRQLRRDLAESIFA